MPKTKLDLTKEYKTYYKAKTTPEIVEFEEGKFLTIEGKGAPGGKEFQAKVGALYSLAYGIKMLMKKEGKDFSRVSRSVKIIKNPKGDTSSRLNVEEVNPNGYYRLSPNKNNV